MNEDYDKMYESYKSSVMFSSNAWDRHVISVEPVDGWPGMGSFKLGDDFTREEFEEKMKTDDSFRRRWDPYLTRLAGEAFSGGRLLELDLMQSLIDQDYSFDAIKKCIKERAESVRNYEEQFKDK